MTRVVLLVEDEPMVRMLTVDMLDVLGWSALEAGAAGEALRLVEREKAQFAAALVDLGLPDRRGEDLVRDLRRLRPGIPVIVTTGRGEDDMDADMRTEGITFLGKPYQLADLEDALAAVPAG
jgi:DNA-binding response OmpR family regulator